MARSVTSLVRSCLQLGPDPARIEQAVEQLNRVDFTVFRRFFEQTDTTVAPPLYSQLKRMNLVGCLGSAHREVLAGHYLRNACRNSLLATNLAQLSRECARRGAMLLLFKGAARLVEEGGFSHDGWVLSDLDVLVTRDDFPKVDGVLVERNYEVTRRAEFHGALKGGYLSPDRLVSIDLHTDLFLKSRQLFYSDCFTSDYRANASSAQIDGAPVRLMDPADEILYAALHDLLGHPNGVLWSSTTRLLRLCRLLESRGHLIDWTELSAKIRQPGLASLIFAYIRYACAEFGLPPESTCKLPAGGQEGGWLRAAAKVPRPFRSTCYAIFLLFFPKLPQMGRIRPNTAPD